ncbi:HIT family protein [Paraburkholderia dinghuensis]|uniref:HIT domain-containing protein n=1 Tax=Paraburkholderia dinghuensis TaxID=2305225 RepID=A0A3N6N0P0_9BURK|nr:HIT domain-containing protein [Paraburkholderia dinghuensis]RQH09629.1 HIT domain-containing protein [Paraburkholderia dinghuensis]
MSACIFCDRANLDLLAENDLAFAIRDKYPVRRLHALILPKRHVGDTFDLTPAEQHAIFELGRQVRDAVMAEDPGVGGYNFGSNNAAVAGQKISHVHFHLIPRRANEEALPAAQADR